MQWSKSVLSSLNVPVLPADPWFRYPLSSLLEGYQCVRHDEHISYGNLGDSVPPFGLAFSSGKPPVYTILPSDYTRQSQELLSLICLTDVSLFSHLSPAGNMQNVLAAANEEGIVRIYNTESRKNPLLKGMCRLFSFTIVLSIIRTYQWLMVCGCSQNGWLMRMRSLT